VQRNTIVTPLIKEKSAFAVSYIFREFRLMGYASLASIPVIMVFSSTPSTVIPLKSSAKGGTHGKRVLAVPGEGEMATFVQW
jgi:hypothetical protein